MELKKAIKCPDGTYIEGTADHLADLAYRYDYDFSDENIKEIEEFARTVKDEKSADRMKYLLESRHEKANGRYDLGQIKIDFMEGTVTEPIQDGDIRIEVWLEKRDSKVMIVVTGFDENGTWSANNMYLLSCFLELEEGGLNRVVDETIAYAKTYDSEE